MKLFTFGDSWTEGVGGDREEEYTTNVPIEITNIRHKYAWPTHLSKLLNIEVENLGAGGSSNNTIFNAISFKLRNGFITNKDFVVIMWTQPARIDVKVNDITQFSNTPYTSAYQSARNDWPEKIVEPINDQDYVEKDWVYGCGFLNGDKELLKTKLFNKHYFYQDNDQFNYLTLVKMIAMQNTIKQMGIPYLFTYFQDYESELAKISHLYTMLDHSCIYNDENIYNITKNNNWFDDDGLHPSVEAHCCWAELINPLITKCSIIVN